MTIFFTSDTHFGHGGIIEMAGRPFADVRAMDDELVAIWNAVVGERDTVWHLGDFSLGPKGPAARYFRRLNGSIHLVRGNHDGDDVVKGCPWASVHGMASQWVDGVRLVLCHYPLLSWRGSAHNRDGHVHSVMGHGHALGPAGAAPRPVPPGRRRRHAEHGARGDRDPARRGPRGGRFGGRERCVKPEANRR